VSEAIYIEAMRQPLRDRITKLEAECDQQRERAEKAERALRELAAGHPELAKVLLGEAYLDRFKTEAVDPHNAAVERAEKALKALRFVEWVPVMAPINRQWCPCCQQLPELGHREKCMLNAALRGDTATPAATAATGATGTRDDEETR